MPLNPPPPPGHILATFAPLLEADWNDSQFGTNTTLTATADPFEISYYIDGQFGAQGNSSGGLGHDWDMSALAPFYIMRAKCSFSLSELPNLPYDDFGWLFGFQKDSPSVYILKDTYKLCFGWDDATPSIQAIAAGTTYELEIYIKQNRSNAADYVWQAYLDGELALEYNPSGDGYDISDYWLGEPIAIGQGSNVHVIYSGEKTVTLTVGDFVWTIESPGGYSAWGLML